MGINKQHISITGIPISNRFCAVTKKELVKQNLGFSHDKPLILVMGGGLGLGSIAGIMKGIQTIDSPLQVVFVAGKNQLLANQLRELAALSPRHHVKVFGYTDEIHKLMAGSDLLISKPGGLTCAEALTVGVPLLIIDPIPGHEEDNARYLELIGAAHWAKNLKEIVQILTDIAHHDRVPLPGQKIHEWGNGNPSKDIALSVLQYLGNDDQVKYQQGREKCKLLFTANHLSG